MRSSVWKLRESELQLAWFVLFFSSFPMHLVQSVAGQQLPSHIPLIKIGGQSRVVAGVTLEGGRRRFSGVLSASGAHRRGGGGLVPRTGCRGRVRPLGFVHLKPRGRDGSEASGTLLAGPGCSPCRRVTVQQQLGPCPAGHRAPATRPAVGPDTRGAAAPQYEGLQPQAKLHLHSLPTPSPALQTGQRSPQREHKQKLRHFPGLCSGHSLDTGHRSGRAGSTEISTALLWGNEP